MFELFPHCTNQPNLIFLPIAEIALGESRLPFSSRKDPFIIPELSTTGTGVTTLPELSVYFKFKNILPFCGTFILAFPLLVAT